MNKVHLTDTVPVNKMHFTDTVSVNKMHLTDTVSVNKVNLTDTVSVNKMHFTDTVSVNRIQYLKGQISFIILQTGVQFLSVRCIVHTGIVTVNSHFLFAKLNLPPASALLSKLS